MEFLRKNILSRGSNKHCDSEQESFIDRSPVWWIIVIEVKNDIRGVTKSQKPGWVEFCGPDKILDFIMNAK